MIQKIILVGTLGRAFELKTSKTGTLWATSSLAVNTKQGGEKKTTWYKLKAFGKAAEILAAHTKTGETLYVEGVPEAEAWLPAGTITPRTQIAVTVNEFNFLGGGARVETAKDEAAQNINNAQGSDDEWSYT